MNEIPNATMMSEVTLTQYHCKNEDCWASLTLPVNENPSYYGWNRTTEELYS